VANSRGFHRGRSPRRLTDWTFGPEEVDRTVTANGQQLWSAGTENVGDRVTLVRLRGLLSLTLLTADAAGSGFFGACGVALVTAQAFAVGATAVPGPLSEVDWDGWLWHSFWDLRTVTATRADGVNSSGAAMRIEIDSKAMRKWEENMVLIGVNEAVESINAVVEIQARTRALVKLA